MKATFALLANRPIYNLVRKLAWEVHRKYHTGIEVTRLPPHISLKQPFDIADLALLEDYMIELADSLSPFEVTPERTSDRPDEDRRPGHGHPVGRCSGNGAPAPAAQPASITSSNSALDVRKRLLMARGIIFT